MKELYFCKRCGKPVYESYGSGTYCGIKCANSGRSPKTYYKTKQAQNQEGQFVCINCGALVKKNRKFCNAKCQQEYQRHVFQAKWEKGEIDVPNSPWCSTDKRLKRILLEKYDYKCSRCGWGEINPYTNTVPLELEHIDGNAENNSPSNLTLLCPNCHSLTETYRGANRGKGRGKTWIPKKD